MAAHDEIMAAARDRDRRPRFRPSAGSGRRDGARPRINHRHLIINPVATPRTPAGRTPGRSAWLDGWRLEDATLAVLYGRGRAPASASTALAAACFRARVAREPSDASGAAAGARRPERLGGGTSRARESISPPQTFDPRVAPLRRP